MKLGFVVFTAIVVTGCCEPGSGNVIQESRPVDSFDQLEVSVPASVHFVAGATSSVKIRTDVPESAVSFSRAGAPATVYLITKEEIPAQVILPVPLSRLV